MAESEYPTGSLPKLPRLLEVIVREKLASRSLRPFPAWQLEVEELHGKKLEDQGGILRVAPSPCIARDEVICDLALRR